MPSRWSVTRAPVRKDGAEGGNVLVWTVLASVVLTIGLAAVSSRTNSGLLAAVLQTKNREARDVAESAISMFINRLNQPENRYLFLAGNGSAWDASTDPRLINPCTEYERTNLVTKKASGVSQPTAEAKFNVYNSSAADGGWNELIPGNSSAQFRVEKIEYFYEVGGVRVAMLEAASGSAAALASEDAKNAIKKGNQRGLIRVTVQSRVTRNGKTSFSRVAREFEVVPKCCWRSFGANQYGGAYWGRDNRSCVIPDPKGGGVGIIAHGGVGGSKNNLDIRDESGDQIAQALCWTGSTGSTDVTIDVNAKCDQKTLSLGSDISLNPTSFNYKQPLPQFSTGGRLASGGTLPTSCTPGDVDCSPGWLTASSSDASALNTLYPTASFGNWVQDPATGVVWVAGYPDKAYNPASSTSDALRWFQYRPSPTSTTLAPVLSSWLASGSSTAQAPTSQTLSTSKDYFYYDSSSNTTQLCNLSGSSLSDCTTLSNCYSVTGPGPYPEVNCNWSFLSSGNHEVYVDTTNAKINFYFQGNGDPAPGATKDEYMGGGGNTQYINVHCQVSSTSSAPCIKPILWNPTSAEIASGSASFQWDCLASGSNADPRCSTVSKTSRPHDTGELFNIFSLGTGKFNLNGAAAGAGFNLYAPNAQVVLKGGGSTDPNFMGRMWAGVITLAGNVKINTLSSNAGFCTSSTCASGNLFLFDMKARSYVQADGF